MSSKSWEVQGHVLAQLNLGVMYFKGEGVPKNHKAAVKWWTKAAEQGEADAQLNLGVMYARGKGVLPDIGKAYMWFNLAAYNDHEIGAEGKDFISKQMTNEQIGRAQYLSEACLAKDYKDC